MTTTAPTPAQLRKPDAVSQWLDARGLTRGAYGRDDVAFAMVPVPGRKTRERVAVTRVSWEAFLKGSK